MGDAPRLLSVPVITRVLIGGRREGQRGGVGGRSGGQATWLALKMEEAMSQAMGEASRKWEKRRSSLLCSPTDTCILGLLTSRAMR